MDDMANYKPINTGLAQRIKQQAEAEKARLKAIMPNIAAVVEAKAEINESRPDLIPSQRNTGLADKIAAQKAAEKARLLAVMPSADTIVEDAKPEEALPPRVITPTSPVSNRPLLEDEFSVFADLDREFGRNEVKPVVKPKVIKESTQKTINISELNTILYDVQKQLRINEDSQLEQLADDISGAIAETIIANSKSYPYDKYVQLVNRFNETFKGE